ncbi:MAG: DUF86 domain-containing protein [bacterium]
MLSRRPFRATGRLGNKRSYKVKIKGKYFKRSRICLKRRKEILYFLRRYFNAIGKIERYTKGVTFENFCKNEMLIDAVIRNFEIIGEAVKSIPIEIQMKYPGIEWKEASGFRNVLIHEYFGIDLEAIWDTINNDIPIFKDKILKVLTFEKTNSGK